MEAFLGSISGVNLGSLGCIKEMEKMPMLALTRFIGEIKCPDFIRKVELMPKVMKAVMTSNGFVRLEILQYPDITRKVYLECKENHYTYDV